MCKEHYRGLSLTLIRGGVLEMGRCQPPDVTNYHDSLEMKYFLPNSELTFF